jgi:uncharacterized protein
MPITPSLVDDVDLAEFLACARYGEIEDLGSFRNFQQLSVSSDPSTGNTALMYASANGHLEIVTLLTRQSKSALNLQNSSGNTALHWASLNGQAAVVAGLLEMGADANLRNSSGDRPFDEAVRRHAFPEICELLAKATTFDEDMENCAPLVVSDSDVEL